MESNHPSHWQQVYSLPRYHLRYICPYRAPSQNRTGDSSLTKRVLCQLRYWSKICGSIGYRSGRKFPSLWWTRVLRPARNSLFLPFELIPSYEDAGFEPTYTILRLFLMGCLLNKTPVRALYRVPTYEGLIHVSVPSSSKHEAILAMPGVIETPLRAWQARVLTVKLWHHIKGWGRVLETPCAYHLNCLVISHFTLRYRLGRLFSYRSKDFSSIIVMVGRRIQHLKFLLS